MPKRMAAGLFGNTRLFAVFDHKFAYPPLRYWLPLVIEKYSG
jgi:hypothetical protein